MFGGFAEIQMFSDRAEDFEAKILQLRHGERLSIRIESVTQQRQFAYGKILISENMFANKSILSFRPKGGICALPTALVAQATADSSRRNAVRNDKGYQKATAGLQPANSVFRPGGRREPDSVGRRGTQRDGAGGSRECKRLIVVARQDPQLGAGPDATVLEEFEQPAIAFIDSAD